MKDKFKQPDLDTNVNTRNITYEYNREDKSRPYNCPVMNMKSLALSLIEDDRDLIPGQMVMALHWADDGDDGGWGGSHYFIMQKHVEFWGAQ
ncbi:hypothetical protein PVL29_025965 [Vitis rotundifolia]|uniref:Uncharacterized protein n=1 Tax=Vitis rotundifolia TaxID=103349 RepID=A0AA38YLA7_VITRO|nr:hypothetical protein PVL29_025965 [Vitis rotundifolia]